MRYFFLREVPFGQDGSYSHEAIVNRTNADLANDLGNLAQRSLSMIAKNCDGHGAGARRACREADKAILDQADGALATAREAMAEQAIHVALAAIFAVVAEANRYFAGQEPWALQKTDPARMETVLYTTAETIRRVAHPVPALHAGLGGKLLDLLAVPADERSFADLGDAGRAGRRARRCRRRSRSSRAMSSRPRSLSAACSSTAIAISTFPDFAEERDAVVARAPAAGVGAHGDDLDAGAALRRRPGDRRGAMTTSSARSARIRTTRPRSPT